MQRALARQLIGVAAALGLVLAVPVAAQVWKGGTGRSLVVLALDASGDVIAAGRRQVPPGFPALSVVRVAGASGAEVWHRDLLDNDGYGVDFAPRGMAVGSPGGVVVAGDIWNNSTQRDFAVIRLSPADGTVVWQRAIDGGHNAFNEAAYAVALDAAGDVVASGNLYVPSDDLLTVVKLAGATGSELWRYSVPGNAVPSVVVDAAGDVIAGSVYFTDQFVVKLSGVDGTELWRHGLHGEPLPSTYVRAFALDSAGDVIGVGSTSVLGGAEDLTVFKLAGATGAEVWRTSIDGSGHGDDIGTHVVIDAAGDVIATGRLDSATGSTDAAVVKLAGASGTELWRTVVSGPARVGFGSAQRAAIDPSGDVVVRGGLGTDTAVDVGVMKLAANDGAPRWLRQLSLPGVGEGDEVAVDAAGAVFVLAGNRYGQPAILRFDGSTGGDYLVPNGRLVVKDSAVVSSRRSLKFTASRAGELSQAFRAPGLGDPTGSGAVLQLVNPTTTETATFPLPAARWQPVMGARGLDGYRYEDPGLVDGPCRQVRVYRVRQQRTRLLVDCRGAQIPFTLDEPAQGTLAVRLDMGVPSVRLCFTFPSPSNDRSTAAGGIGLFRSKSSPTPDACP